MDNTKIESEIYRRTEELLYKIYPTLVNYSSNEKFGLVSKIKDTFYELLKSIALSSKVSSKKNYHLQEADGYLQVLKVLYKLSDRNKEISHNFWREVDVQLTEIEMLITKEIRKK